MDIGKELRVIEIDEVTPVQPKEVETAPIEQPATAD